MGEIDRNEVAALNELWRSDDRQNSSARDRIAHAVSIADPAISAGTAILATGGAGTVGLAIAGGVVAGLNLFDKFLRLGDSTVKENVRELAEAVEAGLSRLERICIENGKGVDELKAQLDGERFTEGTAILVLHALRTKNKKKLDRLAQVLVSGVANDDLEPETLDDMMRAGVELTESDIRLLGRLYKSQKHILKNLASRPFSYQWYEDVGAAWEGEFSRSERDHLGLRGSLMRLRSLGMIAETGANLNGEIAKQHFGLLLEGKKFYERLQEVAVQR
jgi:hypothetical protein